jgi:Tn3 transposase DDE domain
VLSHLQTAIHRRDVFTRPSWRYAAPRANLLSDAEWEATRPIVLWNTIYMQAVLEQFRKEGYPVNEEDKARLSPLIHEHINTQERHFVRNTGGGGEGGTAPAAKPGR